MTHQTMTKTTKLVQLFRAIATQDIDAANSIASQICEGEERSGHRTAARALRGALQGGAISPKPDQLPRPSAEKNGNSFLTSAVVKLAVDVPLSDVVLAQAARRELENVVAEWKKRDQLERRGLSPRAKILFHGPPGCGKSLTARAIAHELRIPIYLVRFDSVIGAYLGQTAIHLRQLFNFAETTACVLLLDELDALGKRRGNPLDVGELDRIVIALMQELEHSKPLGIIIATSNLAKNLDDALWRRFDLALNFKSPTKSALTDFCRRVAARLGIQLRSEVVAQIKKSRSFAEGEAIVVSEARRQTLAEK